MIGNILSGVVKIVTSPIDIAESAIDILSGGDGSKESKSISEPILSSIRDGICKGLEDLDK